jgi:GalNAc-alpha-(1->4)-GalNAc-alpha-(1->3)-diNAcBac-PP-undecaprenol alpha-1,4-N-acetyl-D-galactosaminyltransferase
MTGLHVLKRGILSSLSSKSTRANRVVIVIYSLAGGGAERVVIDLCRYLRDADREVILLTLNGDDPDTYTAPGGVRRERMEIRRVAYSLFQTMWYFFNRIREMRRKLRALDPDVVVSFIDQVNVWTVLCLFWTGIPVVVSERVHPAYNPIPRVWKFVRRLVYPFADAVTVQTKDGAEWFRRWTRVKRTVVIPNAARFPQDLAVEADEVTATPSRSLILAIGRLTEQKGFDLLLDAFHRSGLAQIGWHLAILGEGPERSTLEQKAKKLRVAGALTLPGFVDVGQWLVRSDIFVLSSRFEGFPNALMEAMQMERACVSFDCPSGPCDLVVNDRNGLLVPAEDVERLSDALRRLAADPVLRRRLGAEASHVSERFSPVKVYGNWLCLIDAVAAGNTEALFFRPEEKVRYI